MMIYIKPVGILLCGALLASSPAIVQSQEVDTRATELDRAAAQLEAAANRHVDEARTAIVILAKDPVMAEAIQWSTGIFILPSYRRAALAIGASGGTGVLLRKREDGKWSSPAFFTLGELSVGLQVGAVAGPFAFVLLNDKAIQRFTQRNNFSMGADTGLTVANWKRVARGSIGKGDVIAWSSARGIFADVAAVSVDDIRYDEKMTDAYYHRKLSANDVLSDHVSNNQAQGLQQALGAVSAPNK
jgi:lipid-binding SYLF domain-containing protein